jgi:type II secretory pathway component PulK
MKTLRAIYTFLVKERSLSSGPVRPRTKRQRKRKQRGVALVTVLIAIAITLVLTNQFGTTTNIDLFAAANYRDQMRSHFLARSSQNLAELIIRLQQRVDNIKELSGTIQITDFADQLMLAFCGSPEEVQAAVGFSTSTTKGLGADIGTCGVVGQIGTEDDKINLNCAAKDSTSEGIIEAALAGLVYFPAYDPVFEEADAEGWRRDRTQQVNALLDYIDKDSTQGVVGSNTRGGAVENDGYESLRDPYKPKNNYIDSLGELKLIRGVDDRFWTLFGSAFTVYGGCKVNLSAVSNSQLIASILYLSAAENEPLKNDPKKLFALASLVAKAKQFGVQFTKVDDFIEFVKDPAAQIGALAGQSGTLAGSQASQAVSQGIPGITGGEKLKMNLDKAKLGQMATFGPRRTYRVQAWGEIERKQKNADGSPVFPAIRSTINAVWDTKVVPQNVRKPPVPKGAWVYMRED